MKRMKLTGFDIVAIILAIGSIWLLTLLFTMKRDTPISAEGIEAVKAILIGMLNLLSFYFGMSIKKSKK